MGSDTVGNLLYYNLFVTQFLYPVLQGDCTADSVVCQRDLT
jgi:hypothetical protein